MCIFGVFTNAYAFLYTYFIIELRCRIQRSTDREATAFFFHALGNLNAGVY